MSVRNAIVLLLVLSTVSLLVGCGSGSSLPKPAPPPSGSFSNSNLNGTYVFSVLGIDQNGAPYAAVGTINANGKGGISGGTLDWNDAEFGSVADAPINDNGFYSVSQDGRGTVTIGLPSADNPFGADLVFDFVLQDSFHGLITEFDGNASGSGTLDAQTAGTTPNGTYAFSFSGDTYSGTLFATVGNFTVSGTSISGLEDFNEGGAVSYAAQPLSGSLVLGPSSTPATTLAAAPFSTTLTFDVYAIDATHLKFIEVDNFAVLVGDAYSQTSTAMPVGNLAFTLAGENSLGPFAAGGFMVTDASGDITDASTEDYNEDGNLSSVPPGLFTANYSAGGTGRYTLSNFATFVPAGVTYAAYPSSGGLLLLEIDSLGITAGAAYLQTSGASFATSQGYGLNLTGINLGAATGSAAEVDDIAEFTAASATASPNVTGIVDENFAPGGGPTYGMALSGTYTGPDGSGRYGLTATAGNSHTSTLNGGFALTYYTVDGTTFPFMESDSGQVSTGVIIEQNAAATSAVAKSHHMFVVRPLLRPHAASKHAVQKKK